MFSGTRSRMYFIAKVLGDINALSKGKIGKRVGRRIAGRYSGRGLGRTFR